MTAFAQSPQALFGVLIALECGMKPEHLAQRLGQGVNALLSAADAARSGQVPRQRAWLGERMRSETTRELAFQRIKGHELFLTAWHRVAIQLIARPDGAYSAELNAVTRQFEMSGDKLVSRLRTTLERSGFALVVTPNVRGSEALYRFTPDDAQRVNAIIANGWVVP